MVQKGRSLPGFWCYPVGKGYWTGTQDALWMTCIVGLLADGF
jgi:hypothetical protein